MSFGRPGRETEEDHALNRDFNRDTAARYPRDFLRGTEEGRTYEDLQVPERLRVREIQSKFDEQERYLPTFEKMLQGSQVVTFDGDAAEVEVPHNLGVVPDDVLTGMNPIAPYAHGYQDNTNTNIVLTAQNTWYKVTGYTTSHLVGFTVASDVMTVVHGGVYKIDWSLSFSMTGGAGHDIEGTIGINGTASGTATAHRYIGTGTDTGSMSAVSIFTLEDGDTVEFMVRRTSATSSTAVVEHAHVVVAPVFSGIVRGDTEWTAENIYLRSAMAGQVRIYPVVL